MRAPSTSARVEPKRERSSRLEAELRGQWIESAHGPVFVRDQWFPLEHRHGATAIGAPLAACPVAMAHLLRADVAPHASRVAFFDIETTGPSGGTGTYVILAGFGSFEDAGLGDGSLAFRLRQYFLADIAHERAMLSLLAEDFARFEGVVTYNGRSFDMPLLTSRMTLGRVPFRADRFAHFDLLHPVRALYKHRMPSCTLADAERRLLRIERFEDIPGALIPSIYFDYARSGRCGPMRAVFRHNAEDVLSLTGVLASLASLLSHDEPEPDDALALARWWARRGENARAMELYRTALPWLEGADDWGWAAARYAALCARAGQRDEAVNLWRRLWERGDERAGLALAKHLEHRARDLPAAEEVTRTLLLRCADGDRIALQHRLARIVRKRSAAASTIA